jgi:osmotically-inducible protein OsmY
MEFRKWIAALAVAGLILAPSAAMAQAAKAPAKATVDDSALKSQIEARIAKSGTLKGDDIKVAVDNGVVTLSGTVHSQAQAARAQQLAKITGVTRVESKLDIDAKPSVGDKAAATTGKAIDKTVDTSKKVADKTVEGSKKAGSKTKEIAKDTGEAITDAWITTKVKTDFVGEDALKGSDINVDTDNHAVTLKGTVASEAGRARAIAIAKKTKGVTKVIDNLTIAPPK